MRAPLRRPESVISWEDMLSEPLDAVLVLTSGSHAPVAVAAAHAGVHVFVEKPMCLNLDGGSGDGAGGRCARACA